VTEPSDLDVEAALMQALEDSFRNAITQGRLSAARLTSVQQLLIECGLLVQSQTLVTMTRQLRVIVQMADDAALDLLCTALTDHLSSTQTNRNVLTDEDKARIGEIGELEVVNQCADELTSFGRADLAMQVQQVSLVTDMLGYDVHAPTIGGLPRLLEVKTTIVPDVGTSFRFFLSRNEFEVGRRNPRTWSLVACLLTGEKAQVVGWCRAGDLSRYLPEDGIGRWTEALVRLPRTSLRPGIPTAIC
jgi:hypothetical protein